MAWCEEWERSQEHSQRGIFNVKPSGSVQLPQPCWELPPEASVGSREGRAFGLMKLSKCPGSSCCFLIASD